MGLNLSCCLPELRAGLVAAEGKNKQERRHMELLALFLQQEFTFAFQVGPGCHAGSSVASSGSPGEDNLALNE